VTLRSYVMELSINGLQYLYLYLYYITSTESSQSESNAWEKDTVAADEEHHKVETDEHSRKFDSTVRQDSVVHHHVPIFTGQYLQQTGVTKY